MKRACRLAMSGKGKKVTDMEVYFESVDAMRAVLTEERVNLLKAIKAKKPKSIYELAKVTGRNLKNVSQDVNRLAELGLIDLKKSGDPRRSKKPVLLADRIQVEINI
jgi:predicted transcriptional regulator